MILTFLRFLRGYVVFEAKAKFPERFINITAKNNIRLWGSSVKDSKLYACMYISDYISIRPIARKAGARLRISERKGLPIYVKRCKGRIGLIIGPAVFFLVIFIMSMFIWSVDITGNDTLSYSEILSALKDEGFYIGAFKPALNTSVITRDMMLKNERIGWMAINISGSYASVEIKEESPAPKVKSKSPSNIKARCDGTLRRMNILMGKAMLTEGSGVVEGQLLVSGVVEDEMGGVSFVPADAEIFADTIHKAEFFADKESSVYIPKDGHSKRKRIAALTLDIPLTYASGNADKYYVRSRCEALEALDVVLPLTVTRENVYGFEKRNVSLDKNSAEEIFMNFSALYEVFELGGCDVEEREFSMSEKDGGYAMKAVYHTLEDIAVREPILTDHSVDPEPD